MMACVWGPVWQAFVWATMSPTLFDCLLVPLGRLRVGATAAARLRDDWLQRGVHGPRGGLAYLRRGMPQQQAATLTLLGEIPRRALDALIADHSALVAVDCLAGCMAAEPTGGADLFADSPIGSLTEPLTAAPQDEGARPAAAS